MDPTIIITIGIVIIVLGGIVFTIISNNKIKKNGIEAEAEIFRIEVERTRTIDNESGMVDESETRNYFVKYKNQEGQEIEAKLNNPKMNSKEGDIIKIKYLPEKPNKVVRINE